ncbi:glycosyltransferase family 4 protein [Calothrix sp. 336/3]|uniref:glycosyltransferase family 4 protein n=1 Tax=Calothrix sp. 336/3 TaxID=1337936 RepID=UPI0004E3B2F0|nr:glycosyltransferase family 4 protein [Calothrix sp. 336/3]AKG21131.1 glycosyl transferase [Calothrix sp. 336/3]
MNKSKNLRIALLLPSVELGAYWQPVLHSLRNIYHETILYTGRVWPNFDTTAPSAEAIELVGKVQLLETQKVSKGYNQVFILLSPNIIGRLLDFKPDVIFASSYSLWTLFALLFKPLGRWQLVIAYEGSAPNVDHRNSKFRTFIRWLISRFSDAFITNSNEGKKYLVDVLGVNPSHIFAQPYMVPESEALLQKVRESSSSVCQKTQHPVFLYVGRLEARKGIDLLLQSCAILKQRGYENYQLQIIGTGPQKDELRNFVENQGLADNIQWIGWVDYGQLGEYFNHADVFVFPSLEDTWGMVVLEAMAFGKPVVCSQWAGASEMVVSQKNGYVFDPYNPSELADMMARLIENPDLVVSMGQQSREIIAQHTPETAAQLFADVTSFVLQK